MTMSGSTHLSMRAIVEGNTLTRITLLAVGMAGAPKYRRGAAKNPYVCETVFSISHDNVTVDCHYVH
jgi:hypothetical protein